MEQTSRAETLWLLVTTFTNLGRSMRANIRDMTLKHGEFAMVNLLVLHDKQGKGIKSSTLSRKMQVAQPTITPMITTLERKGLVERIADETDRRVIRVRITPAGKEAREAVMHKYEERLNRMIDTMGIDQVLEMIRLVRQAAACVTDTAPPATETQNSTQNRQEDA